MPETVAVAHPVPPVPILPGTPQPSPTDTLPILLLLATLWGWSIHINSAFWTANPNYHHGWLVPFLVVFFLWRRLQIQPSEFWNRASVQHRPPSPARRQKQGLALASLALTVFPLEVLRTEYFQSGIVLWAINGSSVALTLLAAAWLGGRALFTLVAFPIGFFLSAVPWPAKLEQPLVQQMMVTVASLVSNALIWSGIPVQTNGAVLELSRGTVGIVEACSGIRSLQSGLMICLAVGELQRLPPARRWVLLGVTLALALASNLVRTYALCWILEHQGDVEMHQQHDRVGDITMYSFYFLIWLIGLALSHRGGPGDVWPNRTQALDVSHWRRLAWSSVPDVRPAIAIALAAFATVHIWYWALRIQTQPQVTPQFQAHAHLPPTAERHPFEPEVWSRLGASAGDQFRVHDPRAPMGFIDIYHLFWEPSPMSKVALHHRPDSCMPGSGWRQIGNASQTNVSWNGHSLRFLVFEFERQDFRALQFWGVWRNGSPVDMDYSQRLQALPERYGWLPSNRHQMGVELLSCFIPYPIGSRPPALIPEILPTLYQFSPFQPQPRETLPSTPPRPSRGESIP